MTALLNSVVATRDPIFCSIGSSNGTSYEQSDESKEQGTDGKSAGAAQGPATLSFCAGEGPPSPRPAAPLQEELVFTS